MGNFNSNQDNRHIFKKLFEHLKIKIFKSEWWRSTVEGLRYSKNMYTYHLKQLLFDFELHKKGKQTVVCQRFTLCATAIGPNSYF